MKNSCLLAVVWAFVTTLVSASVNAALLPRLGGLAVYDNVLDISWLTDGNAGAGSAFDDGHSTTDGRMTLANANAWAANLVLYGNTDWRLPTTLDPDPTCTTDTAGANPSGTAKSYNCTGSEMGHLFYNDLSGTAGSGLVNGDPDEALFTNLKSGGLEPGYWSDTILMSNSNLAWCFIFHNGFQQDDFIGGNLNVIAVHDGDVGEVPIPATLWLFGSGLFGLIGIAKCKKV